MRKPRRREGTRAIAMTGLEKEPMELEIPPEAVILMNLPFCIYLSLSLREQLKKDRVDAIVQETL